VGTNNKNKTPSENISNPGRERIARIGFVGGPGGDSGTPFPDGTGYVHTHIVFFSDKANGIRIDPRKLFCGW
jgi:hypothetical protein